MKEPTTSRRGGYPSDVTQQQWEQIDLLLPLESQTGRGLRYARRDVVNAINYRWTTGCSWRMLPHDFPPWRTVYRVFRAWQALGLLADIRTVLLKRDRGAAR